MAGKTDMEGMELDRQRKLRNAALVGMEGTTGTDHKVDTHYIWGMADSTRQEVLQPQM